MASVTFTASRTSYYSASSGDTLDFNLSDTLGAIGSNYVINSVSITTNGTVTSGNNCTFVLGLGQQTGYRQLARFSGVYIPTYSEGSTTVSANVLSTTVGRGAASEDTYSLTLEVEGATMVGRSGSISVTLNYEVYRTAPKAPTTVTLGSNYVSAGGTTSVSWSGASAGTNNPISGYDITVNGEVAGSISTSATSGSYSPITGSTTVGSNVSVRVIVKTPYTSAQSSIVRLYTYGTPTAPTTVSASNTMPNPSENVTLSWSGASGASYNTITKYGIYRASSADGTYTKIKEVTTTSTSGSTTVSSPATAGESYYFKVSTIGSNSESALSSAYVGIGANATPDAPTIAGSGIIHNPRPRLLITVGNDTGGDLQTLSASGWTLSQNLELASGSHVVARKDSALSSGVATEVTVLQSDPAGASNSASTTITYSAITWTDNPIVVGETVVKAAHINEIRTALEDICSYYGIETPTWNEEIVAGVTPDINFPVHVAEILTVINTIASTVNNWDATTSTNAILIPQVTIPTVPKADTITQLRQIISML